MRENLIQYVELLFAGAHGCEEIKQEILQNTLDRYDDLIAEGKVPEAAYRLAISGIGDINEILGAVPVHTAIHTPIMKQKSEDDTDKKKMMRAVAVGLYILCPVPLIVLAEIGNEIIGICGLLAMVAVATMLMILGAKKEKEEEAEPKVLTPQQELHRSIRTLINALGLILYFVLSFTTNLWHITWLIFPIMGAAQQLAKAILDLKEASKHEK